MVVWFLYYGFDLVIGGTDNYFILFDVISCGIIGRELAIVMVCVWLIVNVNIVFFDLWKLFDFSGVCFGIFVVMSCGMKEVEMECIVDWIVVLLEVKDNLDVL